VSRYDAWRHGETGDNGTHPGSPNYDDRRERAIDDLLRDNAWVAAHTAEADDWNDGSFDGEHYSAVERALADLDGIPADRLLGSAALESVLRLAKVHGEARKAQLRMLAEREVSGRRRAA
jgi:antirestriction protein